jgi:hypothetical protein
MPEAVRERGVTTAIDIHEALASLEFLGSPAPDPNVGREVGGERLIAPKPYSIRLAIMQFSLESFRWASAFRGVHA